MSEAKRLGPWGWFVRAFAAGFGATFGVVVASVVAIAGCYALIAAGLLASSSLGGIELNTADTPGKLLPQPAGVSGSGYSQTTVQPAPSGTYTTPVQPSPPVAGPYANAGSTYGGYNPYGADLQPGYGAASTGTATSEEAADAQPAPPAITLPSEPAPALETDSTAPLEPLPQER